jgi:hypothetical protein
MQLSMQEAASFIAIGLGDASALGGMYSPALHFLVQFTHGRLAASPVEGVFRPSSRSWRSSSHAVRFRGAAASHRNAISQLFDRLGLSGRNRRL